MGPDDIESFLEAIQMPLQQVPLQLMHLLQTLLAEEVVRYVRNWLQIGFCIATPLIADRARRQWQKQKRFEIALEALTVISHFKLLIDNLHGWFQRTVASIEAENRQEFEQVTSIKVAYPCENEYEPYYLIADKMKLATNECHRLVSQTWTGVSPAIKATLRDKSLLECLETIQIDFAELALPETSVQNVGYLKMLVKACSTEDDSLLKRLDSLSHKLGNLENGLLRYTET